LEAVVLQAALFPRSCILQTRLQDGVVFKTTFIGQETFLGIIDCVYYHCPGSYRLHNSGFIDCVLETGWSPVGQVQLITLLLYASIAVFTFQLSGTFSLFQHTLYMIATLTIYCPYQLLQCQIKLRGQPCFTPCSHGMSSVCPCPVLTFVQDSV